MIIIIIIIMELENKEIHGCYNDPYQFVARYVYIVLIIKLE